MRAHGACIYTVSMCRRFTLDLDWGQVAERFGVAPCDVRGEQLPSPTYNVAPTRTIGLVAQGRDGRRHLNGAHWSLIPRWSGGTLSYPTYNARMESAQYKPTFAESVVSMRAIIPASGYYEWQRRRPFYFHAPDDEPLAMAGLYSWWRPNERAEWMLTATILTCPAVDGAAQVHDRMPMLVPGDMTAAWLDRAVNGATLMRPVCEAGAALSRSLRFHEVAPLSGDGRRLIAPLDRTEPISLF